MTDQEKSAIPFGRWREPLRISHAVLCCAMLLLLPFFLWWMDRWALGVAIETYMTWGRLIANALPIYLLAGVLVGLSGRIIWSMSIASGLGAIVYVVCRIKMQVLRQPILLQDLYFLRSFDVSTFKLFSSYVDVSAVGCGIVICAVSFFVIAAFVLEGKIKVFDLRWRISILLLGLIGWGAVYSSQWPVNTIYPKLVRNDPVHTHMSTLRGVFNSLIYQNVKFSEISFREVPETIADGIEFLRSKSLWPLSRNGLHGAEEKESVLPDIIVILSESFIDPHIVSGMQDHPDVIPNFRRIAERSCSGYFLPPTYGGGTVRTEFEVLTGMPMKAFPGIGFPYIEMPFKNTTPGLASVLGGYGYRIFGIHGNGGSFWNRIGVWNTMGIVDFKQEKDFIQRGKVRDGLWLSDESMTDLLLEELVVDSDRPAFSMVVSMQAHGPYADGRIKNDLRNPQVYQSLSFPALNEQMADDEWRTYLYHISQADRQLGRLVAALEQRDRPYRLLFFGDHLPGLKYAWDQLKFVETKDIRQQKVPWLIAGCEDHDGISSRVEHAWQLPSALLESAGIVDDYGYFAFSSAIGTAARESGGNGVSDLLEKALQSAARANFNGNWENYVQE